MGLYHANPDEAILIHRDIGSRFSVGMHWGTFPLTAEGPRDPVVELERRIAARGLGRDEFVTMAIGETLRR